MALATYGATRIRPHVSRVAPTRDFLTDAQPTAGLFIGSIRWIIHSGKFVSTTSKIAFLPSWHKTVLIKFAKGGPREAREALETCRDDLSRFKQIPSFAETFLLLLLIKGRKKNYSFEILQICIEVINPCEEKLSDVTCIFLSAEIKSGFSLIKQSSQVREHSLMVGVINKWLRSPGFDSFYPYPWSAAGLNLGLCALRKVAKGRISALIELRRVSTGLTKSSMGTRVPGTFSYSARSVY